MTAPTHAAFGTLCYFIVATCLWWTVSPTVAVVAVLGVGDQDGLIIGGAGVVVFMVIQFFMRKAR